MTRILSALMFGAFIFGSAPAVAQETQSARNAYIEGRELMDSLVMQRRIGDAIRQFEGINIDNKELAALDTRLRVLYKQDFTNTALVRSDPLKNGFRQEIIAYWVGDQYLYVYLLLHTNRNDELKLLHFQFDSDFHKLNALF